MDGLLVYQHVCLVMALTWFTFSTCVNIHCTLLSSRNHNPTLERVPPAGQLQGQKPPAPQGQAQPDLERAQPDLERAQPDPEQDLEQAQLKIHPGEVRGLRL